jgi:hypothetical protein
VANKEHRDHFMDADRGGLWRTRARDTNEAYLEWLWRARLMAGLVPAFAIDAGYEWVS